MRKVTPWISILLVIPLAACSLLTGNNPPAAQGPSPTKSGDQMQTEISQLLTQMPTSTGQPQADQPQGEATQTPNLPTVEVQVQTETIEAVILPTQPPAATETPSPQPQTPESGGGRVSTATLVQTATPGGATQTAPSAVKGTSAPIATSAATAAPSASDPRNWLGNRASGDPMDSPNTWVWPTGRDLYTLAMFRNGRMSVQALTTKDGWRMANPIGQPFTDLYLETTFNVGETCQKDAPGMADHYGIIARVPILQEPFQGYLFTFNCNGEYALRSWNWDGLDERRQEMRMLIDWNAPKTSDNKAVINAGIRTTNKMGLMMIGSKLRLYANGHFLAEYDYSTNNNIPHLSAGYFGVFAGSREDTKFTIWVDEMSYWENPKPNP